MRLGSLRIRGHTLPSFPALGMVPGRAGGFIQDGSLLLRSSSTCRGYSYPGGLCKVCSISKEQSIHCLGCSICTQDRDARMLGNFH